MAYQRDRDARFIAWGTAGRLDDGPTQSVEARRSGFGLIGNPEGRDQTSIRCSFRDADRGGEVLTLHVAPELGSRIAPGAPDLAG